jgi:hypothetical protein
MVQDFSDKTACVCQYPGHKLVVMTSHRLFVCMEDLFRPLAAWPRCILQSSHAHLYMHKRSHANCMYIRPLPTSLYLLPRSPKPALEGIHCIADVVRVAGTRLSEDIEINFLIMLN